VRSQESEEKIQKKEEKKHSSLLTSNSSLLFYYVGSVLAAVLAMKTKEIAFTLPIAVALYEIFFFRGAWKLRLLYLLPLLATLPVIPMTVIDIGGSGSGIMSGADEQLRVGTGISRLDYLLTQFRVIVTYLRLLVLPVNQNLDYDYPVYTTFFTPPVFLSFLLLIAILALAVYLFGVTRLSQSSAGLYDNTHQPPSTLDPHPSKWSVDPALRLVAFGIFWFLLTLSVESSLIPIVDVIMEHRLYLPNFGAATAFATAFYLVVRKLTRPSAREKMLLLGAIVLVLVLGVATYQRNHVWGDPIRLWQDVVAKSPDKGRPNNNLGKALEEAGMRSEGFKVLSRAIAVDPDYFESYYNLAILYLVTDQPDKALPLLETAIRLKPNFDVAYVKMGAALMRGGQFREVIIFLEQNFDRIKDNAEARFYLGAAHAFLGNREAAMRELEFVSQHDKALAASLANLLGPKSMHGSPNQHN
jgi:cytochrome c-type biogenesis protein CcmH/NrfG